MRVGNKRNRPKPVHQKPLLLKSPNQKKDQAKASEAQHPIKEPAPIISSRSKLLLQEWVLTWSRLLDAGTFYVAALDKPSNDVGNASYDT